MADDRRYGSGGTGSQGNSNYQQQGGPGFRYDYGYGPGGYQPPKAPNPSKPPKDGWGEWIGMGVLFLIPSWITKLISVIWFFRKVSSMSKTQKDAYRQDVRRAAGQVRDAFVDMGTDFAQEVKAAQARAAQSGKGRTDRSAQGSKTAQNARQTQRPEDPWDVRPREAQGQARAQRKANGGKGLIIAGGITTGIFGISTIGMLGEILDSLRYGYFSGSDLAGLLVLLAFLGSGVGMLCAGIGKRHRADRYVSYLGYIGANREVPLAHMAATFGVSVNKLCKDLRRMLAKGYLPAGYLDLAEGKLYLTEMGYRQPVREEPQVQTAEEAAAQEDDILRQIRQVNDDIPDEVMSAKIDRIEEITRKILDYQKAHPNREAQLRSFLNYYLPTTLKILRAYAQLDAQGIEGENISAAKARIEGMMDQVVAGFEKQLDKLFRDDAMDITSDVEVLENMLKKDGLSDDGMTMTL